MINSFLDILALISAILFTRSMFTRNILLIKLMSIKKNVSFCSVTFILTILVHNTTFVNRMALNNDKLMTICFRVSDRLMRISASIKMRLISNKCPIQTVRERSSDIRTVTHDTLYIGSLRMDVSFFFPFKAPKCCYNSKLYNKKASA